MNVVHRNLKMKAANKKACNEQVLPMAEFSKTSVWQPGSSFRDEDLF
jgi:hypothetical protein